MDHKEFEKRLNEIMKSLADLDDGDYKEKLKKQVEQAKQNRERGQKALDSFRDSLGVLRVHLKYVVFDLEATKRENAQLRARLEDHENQ